MVNDCSGVEGISFTFFFFFNDTATTEIYTLSLHDALPISFRGPSCPGRPARRAFSPERTDARSEEHTSELQSPCNLVCRLLLEKKNNSNISSASITIPSLITRSP